MAVKDNELAQIKQRIQDSYTYFLPNYERFYKFKNFVFNTALTEDDRNKLDLMKMPSLEFNALEPYISRLLGEFAAQEPGVSVRVADGLLPDEVTKEFLDTVEVVEAHARHILNGTQNDNLQYSIYQDQLAGGFSVIRVHTDYLHPRSFEQRIYIDRVFDPTLCGFDPLARESHKGDGEYCYEISPYTKDQFIAEFGKQALDGISFKQIGGQESFSWSYRSDKAEIVLVVDYYVKRRERKTLVMLSNGEIGLESDYNKRLKEYNEQGGFEVPPIIVNRRKTVVESIELYRVCESKILSYETTDFPMLPLVFVDGNSVMLRSSTSGNAFQMTRPYVYHAEGIQRLRNYSGQKLAQQIQNIIQHKVKIPLEGIPDGLQEIYTDIQLPSTLVYNQFGVNGDRLDPPSEIQQVSPPPMLESTFANSDKMMQSILGNYDAILGINGNNISGRAIERGAVQNSIASDPYLVNYIRALNRVFQIILELIPKFYNTPRSIPVIGSDGKRYYATINEPENPISTSMEYDASKLQIKVEASVNSSIEKQVALQTVTALMGSSEAFARFMNTKGLGVLVDNLEIRGADKLKALAEEFMAQELEAASQQAGQPSPIEIEAQTLLQVESMKAEQRMMDTEAKLAMKSAELAIDKQKADTEAIKVAADINTSDAKVMIEAQKADAEIAKDQVESLGKLADEANQALVNSEVMSYAVEERQE